jgi:hypothetical protein
MAKPAGEVSEWYRPWAAQVTLGRNVETEKELVMQNQTSAMRGASPKHRRKIDPASKKIGEPTPAADSLAGTSVPADTAGGGGTRRPIKPHGVKIGHD